MNTQNQENRYKMIVAYDGTNYAGWQIQSEAPTVQQELQDALFIILKKKVDVIGAGRTDSQVHAMGQVAHFTVDEKLDHYNLLACLNGVLPPDIRVFKIEEVSSDFHARYSAINKVYHYHLNLGFVKNPFTRLYSWHVRAKLDLSKLKEAADIFVGTHDFTSFANELKTDLKEKKPVRTLKRLEVVVEEFGVRLEFEAKSFLYKMVRNITGTLVEVARGKKEISDIEKILAKKDRRAAGQTAPGWGLFLMRVDYPNI